MFLKNGVDLSILVSQKLDGSCKVLIDFIIVPGLELGPLLRAGPKGYLPEFVIAIVPFLLITKAF